jgi:energy-coupling factor transport system permease protein
MFLYSNKSLFSKTSELAKILVLVFFIVLSILANGFISQGILFIALLFLLLISGFRDYKLFLGLLPFLILADIGFFIFLQGTAINVPNLIVVSNLRIFNIAMATAFFSFSTDPFALVKLMKKAHFPEIVFLPIFIVFRFLPEVERDFSEIRDIQKIKGISMKKPVLFIKSLLVPLFITSLEKADELAIAYYLRKKAGREL